MANYWTVYDRDGHPCGQVDADDHTEAHYLGVCMAGTGCTVVGKEVKHTCLGCVIAAVVIGGIVLWAALEAGA
jgi:hypothetical protein